MATTAEGNHVRELMSVGEFVIVGGIELSNRRDMMDIGIAAEFTTSGATGLAHILVTFKCRLAH